MLTGSRIEADKWQIPVFSSNWENILSGIQAGCKLRLWESQPAGKGKEERTSVKKPFPLNLFPKTLHLGSWKSLEPGACVFLSHFPHETVKIFPLWAQNISQAEFDPFLVFLWLQKSDFANLAFYMQVLPGKIWVLWGASYHLLVRRWMSCFSAWCKWRLMVCQ